MERLEHLELLQIEDSPSSEDDTTIEDFEASHVEEMDENQGRVLLHIFNSRHIRLQDNISLFTALAQNPDKFYAVYILEGLDSAPVAPLRWKFMLECIEDVRDQLAEFGLKLYCLEGETMQILSILINDWKVTHLSINMDPDVNFQSYNEKIRIICARNNIALTTDTNNHRLLSIPSTYTQAIPMIKFRTLLAEAITAKQQNIESEVTIQDVTPPLNSEQLAYLGTQNMRLCPLPSEIPQFENLFTAEERDKLTFLFKGGERSTHQYLIEYREMRLRHTPGAEIISPIQAKEKPISPHLRFGCITPRQMFKFLLDLINDPIYSREKINITMAGLIARDFALQVSQTQAMPERIISLNKLCLPIPWDRNPNLVESLNDGKTGFPFFDAAIAQIKTEGFAVSEVTEALATFATNNLLWISWEEGVKLFYENMINFDLPIATHNWLEGSASTLVTGKQVLYQDPMQFVSREMDPNGEYIRKYLPQLRDIPNEYIHNPDQAPLEVQQAANCIIGVDYPNPLFEYTCRNGICCKRMKVFMEVVDTAAHAEKLPHVVERCQGQIKA